MIVSFFESLKYVGHLYPVTFLRMLVGYYYAQEGYKLYYGDFLTQPRLAAQINEWLPKHEVPEFYRQLFEKTMVTHWQPFSYVITFLFMVIGVSYLLGFLVRPFALVAMALSWHFLYISSPDVVTMNKLLLIVNFSLCWIGAGRCLGLDYHFFKRHRGILW